MIGLQQFAWYSFNVSWKFVWYWMGVGNWIVCPILCGIEDECYKAGQKYMLIFPRLKNVLSDIILLLIFVCGMQTTPKLACNFLSWCLDNSYRTGAGSIKSINEMEKLVKLKMVLLVLTIGHVITTYGLYLPRRKYQY